MRTSFENYLRALNITFNNQDSDVISFNYHGLNFLCVTDCNDPYFIRLVLPNIAEENNINNINQVINDYNVKYKAAKMLLINNSIWISIEQFVYYNDNMNVINAMFSRMINILENIIHDFRNNEINTTQN